MSSDEDTGSIRIPATAAAIGERINVEVKRVRKAERWIGKLTGFGIAGMAVGLLLVVILATIVARGPIPEHWRQTINALGLALFIAGVATACSGLSMSFARRHVQLAKLEQGADAVEHQSDVGRLAAQLEKVAYNQTEIRAAIAANERQRTADLDQLREASRKAIEGFHEVLDEVRQLLEGMHQTLGGVHREVHGLRERLAAGLEANAKGLIMIKAEMQTLKDLQGDLERDLAALIVSRRQPDSQANGNGTVANLRSVRPENTN